jgi:hypothetical protein
VIAADMPVGLVIGDWMEVFARSLQPSGGIHRVEFEDD